MTTHFIYLHGFASSPASKKANLFKERFTQLGIALRVPDLNMPDFAHLTLSAMLERVDQEVKDCPAGAVCLLGSSMGGLTALHYADQHPGRIERMMLMAPAFDFMENRRRQLGESGIADWQRSGWLSVFNYQLGYETKVHYELLEDIKRYDSFTVKITIPTLIFHGRQDDSVDSHQSIRFAEGKPNVILHLVQADHELLDQMDVMWAEASEFFNLPTPLQE
jgi:uncharacterized protein